MDRRVILGLALAFTSILGVLSLYALVRYGPRPLELLSLLVLAMFVYGILGALREPPK